MVDQPTEGLNLQNKYIEPVVHAAQQVLETMTQTPVIAQEPRWKHDASTSGDITAVMRMTSDTIAGFLIISFSQPCILAVVAKMLTEPPRDVIDEEVVDAVGELANMICGGTKARLTGHQFDLATPAMVVGQGVDLTSYLTPPTLAIPFRTEHGSFMIETNLARPG